MNVSIRLTGIEAAVRRIGVEVEKRDEAIRRRTAKAGLNIANGYKRGLTDQGAVDRGQLRSNVRNMSADGGKSQTIGIHEAEAAKSDVKYAPGIEFGTGPHWVPLPPLLAWARRKFQLGDTVIGRAKAGAIARGTQIGIAAHGTRKRPALMPAYDREMHDYLIDVGRILRDGK